MLLCRRQRGTTCAPTRSLTRDRVNLCSAGIDVAIGHFGSFSDMAAVLASPRAGGKALALDQFGGAVETTFEPTGLICKLIVVLPVKIYCRYPI